MAMVKCSLCGSRYSEAEELCPFCFAEQDRVDESSAEHTTLKRAFIFIQDEVWDKADEYCEKALDINPECFYAYIGKLLVENKAATVEACVKADPNVASGRAMKNALRYADDKQHEALEAIISKAAEAVLSPVYEQAAELMASEDIKDVIEAEELFRSLGDYSDSAELAQRCRAKAEEALEEDYKKAFERLASYDTYTIRLGVDTLEAMPSYKESRLGIEAGKKRMKEIDDARFAYTSKHPLLAKEHQLKGEYDKLKNDPKRTAPKDKSHTYFFVLSLVCFVLAVILFACASDLPVLCAITLFMGCLFFTISRYKKRGYNMAMNEYYEIENKYKEVAKKLLEIEQTPAFRVENHVGPLVIEKPEPVPEPAPAPVPAQQPAYSAQPVAAPASCPVDIDYKWTNKGAEYGDNFAKQQIDYARMGFKKQDGSYEIFSSMCSALNNNHSIREILDAFRGAGAENVGAIALPDVNTSRWETAMDAVRNVIAPNEQVYIFTDNGITAKGKVGMFVTSERLIFINKGKLRYAFFRDFQAFSKPGGSSPTFSFNMKNGDSIQLSSIGAENGQMGLIMAIMCRVIQQTRPDIEKIKFTGLDSFIGEVFAVAAEQQ